MTIIQQQAPCVLRTNNEDVLAIRECQLHRNIDQHHCCPEPSHARAPSLNCTNAASTSPKYHDKNSIFRPICEERSVWCPPLYRNITLLSSPSQDCYYNPSPSSSIDYTLSTKGGYQELPSDFIPPKHSFLSSSSSSVSEHNCLSDLNDDADGDNKNDTIRSKQRCIAISSPTHQAVKLQANDIICGRGAPTNFQSGNQSYRELIKEYEASYLSSKRSDKPHIAMEVLDILKGRGARFVKREKERNGRMIWVEISEQRAYEKVCQSLREGAPEMRRRMLLDSVKKTHYQYETDEDRSVDGVSSEQVLYTDESLFCHKKENYSPIPFY